MIIGIVLLSIAIGMMLAWILAIVKKTSIHWTVTVVFIVGTAALLSLPFFYANYL